MSAAYDVPDHKLDDPRQDEEMTPEQALDDGDKQAADDFFGYITADNQYDELYDFIMSKADDPVMRANIKRWSDQVQRGEL